MVKVLHILPRTPVGGVGSFLKNTQLRINKDYNFDYLIIENVKNSNFIDFAKKNESEVYLLDEKLSLFNTIKIKKKINAILKKNKYDIVHLHSANVASLVFPICKKHGIEIRILHSHATKYSDNLFKAIRNYFLQLPMGHYATHYIACSSAAGKFLFKNHNFKVVYNGIDTSIFQPKYYKINNDEIILGHVGNFNDQKNHKFLIEIFKKIHEIDKSYKLWLFGDGKLMDDIKNKVRENNLTENVFFFGKVNDIQNYYDKINLILLPSLYEGFPLVAMEAQAYGIPIIASDRITKEIDFFGDTRFLGIRNKDVQKWVTEIIATDFSQRKIKSELFRKSKFTIDNTTKQLELFYEDCLKG
ncbi:glycosyltransferase [uncultured Anaerococcus sp.]|uniref:glycosyltransferase n=1 Tax=uncultured Anaerococcus sp. TaxID=293428 RepID=UPI00288BEF26|nr:glycosyltransferase [uncultured Anaerococcus sp.]